MTNDKSSYIIRKSLNEERPWQGKGPELPHLDIELTERCNNNCIHCYINQPQDHRESIRREMSTLQVKHILDEAAAMGCLTVRLTGGEPLLRPDFKDIYLYVRKCGIKISLFTNATLITKELVDLFKKYPPGEPIEITLYGMTEQTYETISRVKGSFAAAMTGINLLVENCIPIILKSIRLQGGDDGIIEFQKFAEKYSVKGISGGISMDFNLRARRDSEEKNKRISRIRATPQETLAVLCRDKDAYLKGQKQFAEHFMHPGGDDIFSCGCGKGGSVDAYGKLQPCLLLRHPELVYDLDKGAIKDAINRFFPEVLHKKAENPHYRKRCAVCFLKGLCNQCPAWSFMENGTLDTPVEYLCEVAHEQARYLGLIQPEEKAWQIQNWQERIDNFVKEDNL
jgi:radical SAM protein with 4Fe4S-binding SPASM domain